MSDAYNFRHPTVRLALHRLRESPCTSKELAAVLSLDRRTAKHLLSWLFLLGLVYEFGKDERDQRAKLYALTDAGWL